MDDFSQQDISLADQPQRSSRTQAILADNYTFLLVVALLVLLISLAYPTTMYFRYYGGLDSSKPVFGEVTAVSQRGIQINIGSKQGLAAGQKLLALRRGVFLADLSVKTADDDAATVMLAPDNYSLAEPQDATKVIARGDTVVLSGLDSRP